MFPDYATACALGPADAASRPSAELPAARRALNHVANRYLFPGSGSPGSGCPPPM